MHIRNDFSFRPINRGGDLFWTMYRGIRGGAFTTVASAPPWIPQKRGGRRCGQVCTNTPLLTCLISSVARICAMWYSTRNLACPSASLHTTFIITLYYYYNHSVIIKFALFCIVAKGLITSKTWLTSFYLLLQTTNYTRLQTTNYMRKKKTHTHVGNFSGRLHLTRHLTLLFIVKVEPSGIFIKPKTRTWFRWIWRARPGRPPRGARRRRRRPYAPRSRSERRAFIDPSKRKQLNAKSSTDHVLMRNQQRNFTRIFHVSPLHHLR